MLHSKKLRLHGKGFLVACGVVDVQFVLSIQFSEMAISCASFDCQNRQHDKREVAESC